ncbi:MAG: RNA 2',3'-cyclic phosphodiesterase [bacterium]|nr:RNA 2',3'-cyclic phosphodiesterase [bacterium]
MRLFIAAELPDNMLDALAETSADLRACVQGRYVRPDMFHITLAFLGEVEAARIPTIEGIIERVVALHSPIEAALDELGSFGKKGNAILWQGLAGNTRALAELASDMRRALEGEGFTFDPKPFRAHITLMRKANLIEATLMAPHKEDGIIDTVTLFHSHRVDDRLVYEPIYRAILC